jgi:uncharacterized protein (TIGR03435 family)
MRTIRSGFKYCVAGFALCGVLIGLQAAAQQAEPAPKESFDVLSVKQLDSARQSGSTTPIRQISCQFLEDRVRCQLPLLGLIEDAYDLRDFEVDAPKWMKDQNHVFAVEGTMPPGTTVEVARRMLRQGLAERFGLQIHWEKRDIPVYALVPGKNGVKIQPLADPEHMELKPIETRIGTIKAGMWSEAGRYYAAITSLDTFAANLESRAGLDRPVVNMTGLTGVYSFDLRWPPPDPPSYVDPAILPAMEKQLGLRVEKRTVPINVLVVDHAEAAPSAN